MNKVKLNSGYYVLVKKNTFGRTDGKQGKNWSNSASTGKNWSKTPQSEELFTATEEWYENYVNATSFFNSFGYGATSRNYYGYTEAGYIPIWTTTISPGRTQKNKYAFTFLSRTEIEESGTFEQIWTIQNCSYWERIVAKNHICYVFLAQDENKKWYRAIWDGFSKEFLPCLPDAYQKIDKRTEQALREDRII